MTAYKGYIQISSTMFTQNVNIIYKALNILIAIKCITVTTVWTEWIHQDPSLEPYSWSKKETVNDGHKKWSGTVHRKPGSSTGQHGKCGVTTHWLFSFCQVFCKAQGSGKICERIWGKSIKKVDKVDKFS